ncbi:MAG TPA: hypothetical protein VGF67_28170 [Ktedonobacteraceae bacterium]|jgi:hypothetical protein
MMNVSTRILRSLVPALLLSLLLLAGSGMANASSLSRQDVTRCLAAAPATQTVAVNQLAHVQVTVNCLPSPTPSYVEIAWGDQTISRYPLCIDACPVPPLVVNAAHSYIHVGDFHPDICVVPSPSGSVPLCVQVEIIVIQLA